VLLHRLAAEGYERRELGAEGCELAAGVERAEDLSRRGPELGTCGVVECFFDEASHISHSIEALAIHACLELSQARWQLSKECEHRARCIARQRARF
jgi:hypothetical protein